MNTVFQMASGAVLIDTFRIRSHSIFKKWKFFLLIMEVWTTSGHEQGKWTTKRFIETLLATQCCSYFSECWINCLYVLYLYYLSSTMTKNLDRGLKLKQENSCTQFSCKQRNSVITIVTPQSSNHIGDNHVYCDVISYYVAWVNV